MEKMDKIIYVFQLEQSKYFLYLSSASTSFHTKTQIMLEAEIEYDYLKKYKPIKIIKEFEYKNIFDVDSRIKEYMLYFGYDNVRGGSYSEEILTPGKIQFVMDELTTASNSIDNAYYHLTDELVKKYTKITFARKDILHEKNTWIENYKKYRQEKMQLEIIQKLNPEQFLKDLKWLKKTCFENIEYYTNGETQSYLFSLINKEQKIKYKELLVKIKQVYIYYSSYNNTNNYLPCIKYPEFLFDDFFYHFNNIHTNKSIIAIEKFCQIYTLFANSIINKMDGYLFDVGSWDKYIEWKTPRVIYLLDKMLGNYSHA